MKKKIIFCITAHDNFPQKFYFYIYFLSNIIRVFPSIFLNVFLKLVFKSLQTEVSHSQISGPSKGVEAALANLTKRRHFYLFTGTTLSPSDRVFFFTSLPLSLTPFSSCCHVLHQKLCLFVVTLPLLIMHFGDFCHPPCR